MLAGVAVASVAEARLNNKVGFSHVVQYSILAVTVLLIVSNRIMYKRALGTPES